MSYKHETFQENQINWLKSEKKMNNREIAVLDLFNTLMSGLVITQKLDQDLLEHQQEYAVSHGLPNPKQLLKSKFISSCSQLMEQYQIEEISVLFPNKYDGDDLRLQIEKIGAGFSFKTGDKVEHVDIDFGKYDIKIGGVDAFYQSFHTLLSK